MRIKKGLIKEIIARISRLIIVGILSLVLYPYLIDFINLYNVELSLGFLLSYFILLMIMLIVHFLYSVIKQFLLGQNFDANNNFIVLFFHSLLIALLVILTISFYDSFGLGFTILSLLIWETIGLSGNFVEENNELDESVNN